MKILLTFNQRLKNFILYSPYVPNWAASLFGNLRGRLVYWVYRSRFCPTPSNPRHYIAKLLSPGDTFFDIGASYGITAMVATVAVGKNGVVYAFEPQKAAFEELTRIKARFGWSNVTPVQTLVGEKVGEQELYEDPENSQLASLSPMWRKGRGHAVSHPVTTLDAWTASHNIQSAALVKIDVEGAEFQVIKGAREFLAKAGPCLLLEINNRDRRLNHFGYRIDDLLAELRALGYHKFYALRRNELVPFTQESELLDTDRDMVAQHSTATHLVPTRG